VWVRSAQIAPGIELFIRKPLGRGFVVAVDFLALSSFNGRIGRVGLLLAVEIDVLLRRDGKRLDRKRPESIS
jgi:hypothetical protein